MVPRSTAPRLSTPSDKQRLDNSNLLDAAQVLPQPERRRKKARKPYNGRVQSAADATAAFVRPARRCTKSVH
jgi:hypothetical protein